MYRQDSLYRQGGAGAFHIPYETWFSTISIAVSVLSDVMHHVHEPAVRSDLVESGLAMMLDERPC